MVCLLQFFKEHDMTLLIDAVVKIDLFIDPDPEVPMPDSLDGLASAWSGIRALTMAAWAVTVVMYTESWPGVNKFAFRATVIHHNLTLHPIVIGRGRS